MNQAGETRGVAEFVRNWRELANKESKTTYGSNKTWPASCQFLIPA